MYKYLANFTSIKYNVNIIIKPRRNQMKEVRNKGVTLVALVVTIVVLLILAGVTIGNLTGDNSIIKEAKTAKELEEKATLEELVEMSIIKAEEKHRNPTMQDIITELKNNKVITNDEQVNTETGAITTDKGYLIEGKLDDYVVIP